MDILRGQVEQARGNSKAAYAHWQHAVDNYPESYDSYQALIALIDAGIKVDELQRAVINYHANQFANTLAALDRYFATTPKPEAKAFYYAALAHRALGRTQSATQRFQDVIDKFPNDPLWAEAWDEKAYTQWGWADDYNGAVDTLTRFAEAAPTPATAPSALYDAGRIAERGNTLNRAAQIWASINLKYPESLSAPEGSFFAGITYYRLNDLNSAQAQFEITAKHPKATDERKASAWLWIGKIKMVRGDTSANEALAQGAAADAGGYYSLRSTHLREGTIPFKTTRYDFGFDYAKEKREAEVWLTAKLNVANLNSNVLNDKRWGRAKELWQLGLSAEAKEEFTALRIGYAKDAVALYQMSLAMRELGAYTPAIRAMRNSIDALGIADTFSVPPFFTHIRFGPYYSDLIIKGANDYNLDPFFLLALMRQESLFESVAVSSAAAQGLMQIIPPTGDWISQQIKWPNYQVRDLQRPYINVEFGTFYIDRQRDDFNGDLFVALAAYNAGPGNASKWAQVSKGDPDLFVEVIRLDQPRDYIRQIYEFYYIYKNLYGR
jgi:soluble lytic murein transglycosylase